MNAIWRCPFLCLFVTNFSFANSIEIASPVNNYDWPGIGLSQSYISNPVLGDITHLAQFSSGLISIQFTPQESLNLGANNVINWDLVDLAGNYVSIAKRYTVIGSPTNSFNLNNKKSVLHVKRLR